MLIKAGQTEDLGSYRSWLWLLDTVGVDPTRLNELTTRPPWRPILPR
jgi:hypothetical protein